MYNFPIACVYRFSLSLVLIHPLKAIRTLEKKKKKGEAEEEHYSLQTEPPWELNALSGTDSVLCARCKYIIWEAPPPSPRKRGGGVSTTGETPAKELNLERSDFVFDRQPDAFHSGRAHQWLSGDLTGENFSAHNHQRKTTNIVVFISDMG